MVTDDIICSFLSHVTERRCPGSYDSEMSWYFSTRLPGFLPGHLQSDFSSQLTVFFLDFLLTSEIISPRFNFCYFKLYCTTLY